MAYNPIVDSDKCVGCGECVDVCPVEVYELQDGKSNAVNGDVCFGCESCLEVCEHGALSTDAASFVPALAPPGRACGRARSGRRSA